MKISIFAISVFFLVSCGNNSSNNAKSISADSINNQLIAQENKTISLPDDFKWRLIWLSDKPVADSINGEIPAIQFNKADSSFSGTMGCNRIGAKYLIKENTIQFSKGFATKMFCQDLWAEDTFLKNMDSINHFSMVGDSLQLLQNEKAIAIFTKYNNTIE